MKVERLNLIKEMSWTRKEKRGTLDHTLEQISREIGKREKSRDSSLKIKLGNFWEQVPDHSSGILPEYDLRMPFRLRSDQKKSMENSKGKIRHVNGQSSLLKLLAGQKEDNHQLSSTGGRLDMVSIEESLKNLKEELAKKNEKSYIPRKKQACLIEENPTEIAGVQMAESKVIKVGLRSQSELSNKTNEEEQLNSVNPIEELKQRVASESEGRDLEYAQPILSDDRLDIHKKLKECQSLEMGKSGKREPRPEIRLDLEGLVDKRASSNPSSYEKRANRISLPVESPIRHLNTAESDCSSNKFASYGERVKAQLESMKKSLFPGERPAERPSRLPWNFNEGARVGACTEEKKLQIRTAVMKVGPPLGKPRAEQRDFKFLEAAFNYSSSHSRILRGVRRARESSRDRAQIKTFDRVHSKAEGRVDSKSYLLNFIKQP